MTYTVTLHLCKCLISLRDPVKLPR
jgi:nicotinamidase-related amidase